MGDTLEPVGALAAGRPIRWTVRVVYRIAANLVLALHVAFLLFVIAGGLLLHRWPGLAWLHIPAFLYGVVIQIVGFRCILTDIQKRFLERAGQVPYPGECLPHYFWSKLGLTGSEPIIVVVFIAFVVLVNVRPYLLWAAA